MKTREHLKKVKEDCLKKHDYDLIASRLCVILREFEEGFRLIRKYPKSVTIFGSARLPEDHPYSVRATELAKKLSEKGYAIVTGGGHGIMGAAHKGGQLGNGDSVGINIELPFEQTMNEYISDGLEFHHFFSRKVILSYAAEAFIYFPGGFGTMDEFFEILTLKQTKKIPDIPIFLYGSEYWRKLEEFFKEVLIPLGTISPEDLNLYTITDDVDEIVEGVLASPIRNDVSSRYGETLR